MFAPTVQKNARLFAIHCLTGTPCGRPGLRLSLQSILGCAAHSRWRDRTVDTLRGADPGRRLGCRGVSVGLIDGVSAGGASALRRVQGLAAALSVDPIVSSEIPEAARPSVPEPFSKSTSTSWL